MILVLNYQAQANACASSYQAKAEDYAGGSQSWNLQLKTIIYIILIHT